MKVENLLNKSNGRITVYCGYAWQHVEDCVHDSRWTIIKRYFKATNDALENRYGVGIDFRRLRASHGRFIWESVCEKINKSDVLIFDIGAIPARLPSVGAEIKYTSLNENVILELGAALAKPNAKVLILRPKSFSGKMPSDLSGLCYTSYIDTATKEGVKRTFEDKWGVLPQYRSMIADAIEDHGWGISKEDDDDIERSKK